MIRCWYLYLLDNSVEMQLVGVKVSVKLCVGRRLLLGIWGCRIARAECGYYLERSSCALLEAVPATMDILFRKCDEEGRCIEGSFILRRQRGMAGKLVRIYVGKKHPL